MQFFIVFFFIYFSSDFPFNQSRTQKSRNTNTTCHIRLQRRHNEIIGHREKQFSEILFLRIQKYIFRISKKNFLPQRIYLIIIFRSFFKNLGFRNRSSATCHQDCAFLTGAHPGLDFKGRISRFGLALQSKLLE